MIILYYSLRLSNKSLVNEISERAAYFPKNNKALARFWESMRGSEDTSQMRFDTYQMRYEIIGL